MIVPSNMESSRYLPIEERHMAVPMDQICLVLAKIAPIRWILDAELKPR